MGLIVGACIDGETTWHAEASLGTYHTLCGLSLDDDEASRVEAPRGTKIDCQACANVWVAARAVRSTCFGAGVVETACHTTGGYQNRKMCHSN